MSVSLIPTGQVEDVHLLRNYPRNRQAIELERWHEYLHSILTQLASEGKGSFVDLLLRRKNPFLDVAAVIDVLPDEALIFKQSRMNRRYNDVVAILFSAYHAKGRTALERETILELSLSKKSIDSSNDQCPIKRYWQSKGEIYGQKVKLDKSCESFPNFDLTPLLDSGEADSNQSVRVIYVSETLTEFHIRSDVSSYLPDLPEDDSDRKKAPKKYADSAANRERIRNELLASSASVEKKSFSAMARGEVFEMSGETGGRRFASIAEVLSSCNPEPTKDATSVDHRGLWLRLI